MLQAFIDDSGTDHNDPQFVLAGFLSDGPSWAAFADEWKFALDREGLAYFKMSDAFARSGQFTDRTKWTLDAIDRLVAELVQIIQKHALRRLSYAFAQSDYKLVQGSWPMRKLTRAKARRFHARLDHPYFFCMYGLLGNLVRFLEALEQQTGIYQQVDVYFDEQQPFGADALAWYWVFKQVVPHADRYLGSPPTHRDDKTFQPLQAADLYAGQLHRSMVGHPLGLWTPKAEALKLLNSLSPIEGRWTRRDMEIIRSLIRDL